MTRGYARKADPAGQSGHRGYDEPDMEPEPISEQMDQLACDLIDYSLDLLGKNGSLTPTIAVEDVAGKRVLLSFDNEEVEECLEDAHAMIREAAQGDKPIKGLSAGDEGRPQRYALAYDGAIREDGAGAYKSALIVEYGEQGMSSGYSAYLLYKHAGRPQKFVWTEPAAAGEVELLV